MRALIWMGVTVVMATFGVTPAPAFEELDAKVSLPPMAKPSALPVGYKLIGLKDGEKNYVIEKTAEKKGMEILKASDGCSWTRPTGELFASSVEWTNCNGRSGTQDVKLRGEIWPLVVGKTWHEEITGRWQTNNKCAVKAQVRVRLKAGEFDTYKVECVDSWNTRTRYVSPQLQSTVYSVTRHDTRGTTKWEFIREEIPK